MPIFKLEPVPASDAEIFKKLTKGTAPLSQVPYGIKMIYGDPNLNPEGISGGTGIIVAVLDTGSIDHRDFYRADGTSIIAQCVDFTKKKGTYVEGTCKDGNGHGTHVIGTVAAAGGIDGLGIFGVAPGASIYSYKVLYDHGGGYADDIAWGIELAANRGAHVISMSFGSNVANPLIADAILYASSRGVLLVAAAGNSGPNSDTIGYPAAFKEVVAVGALNSDETVASFSSRGMTDGDDGTITDRELEVSGPGRDVLSTSFDGTYALKSGTSMAAPHIAGLAAKMWAGSASKTRSWLVSQAKKHDITKAESATDATVGYDIASGYGLPQVNTSAPSTWAD